MRYIKTIVLLAILMFPSLYGSTFGCNISKTHSVITIKEKTVQGTPKGSTIQATINGHSLTVVFTENLGNVQVEVTDSTGGTVDYWDIWTSGSWSETDQAWEEERKAVYEYDDEGMKEAVSFYKKSGEEWIRDKFTNHPLFINPAEKWQQNSMRFYYYETYFHEGNVNQFEIRYIYTEAPVYLSEPENKEHVTGVFPNPGTDHVKVAAGVDNAVVRFYDLQGRLRDARPFDFSTTINAGGWPAGVYLWEIWRDDQKLGSGKWVKN